MRSTKPARPEAARQGGLKVAGLKFVVLPYVAHSGWKPLVDQVELPVGQGGIVPDRVPGRRGLATDGERGDPETRVIGAYVL
jgi:hypothetical protein